MSMYMHEKEKQSDRLDKVSSRPCQHQNSSKNLIFFFSLQNSGIQFEKHEQEGIDPIHFAEIMLVSGLVLREPVKWLSFHSGYDFGYLLNLLTNQNLPKTESEFFELLKLYFPNVYDVKYLMKSCKNLKGGLQV